VGAVAALKFTGIEGTSTNKVDVAPSGQLLTTDAPPSDIFNVSGTMGQTLVSPSGKDAIVTQLSVAIFGLTAGQEEDPNFWVTPAANCAQPGTSGVSIDFWYDSFPITGSAVENLTFPTGIAVPNGDFLCSHLPTVFVNTGTRVTVSGYFVPSGSVHAPNNS